MAAMLPNASNLNIGYAVQNNHFGNTTEGSVALKDLYAHVAGVALHTSEARVAAPKCHEETRKAVQQQMCSWASREPTVPTFEQPRELLWLTGPAGTGKTAIMGSVSDTLGATGQLTAAFYFSLAMGTTSKKFFVTTLAYQMAVHKTLRGRLERAILGAIRDNPDVFDMSLARQLQVLILEPLRATQGSANPSSPPCTCILVDGVDECDGSQVGTTQRSKQDNQIEVLSILFQAASDPAFPFNIIIASRPETWIRKWLMGSVVGKIREIFLDEKWSPDRDIEVYLEAKFAEKCQQSGINPLTWPLEDAIAKLVENASGQFIYAATVVRWVDTPGTYPQAQLDAVLNLKIHPRANSHPLSMLDALYTSILRSTPDPHTTIPWVKSLHHIQEIYRGLGYMPSAWTLGRLFESHEGQAQSILGGLPSLIYKLSAHKTDLGGWQMLYGSSMPEGLPSTECELSYAFYHKSLLDYLNDDSRCGVAFPNLNEEAVKIWLVGRISRALKCPGVEVPMAQGHLNLFQRCVLDIVTNIVWDESLDLDVNVFEHCVPTVWLRILEMLPELCNGETFVLRALYILVHSNCRRGLPCNPGCKQWRRAISKLPSEQWRIPGGSFRPWTKEDLRLDRFCIKRFTRHSIYH